MELHFIEIPKLRKLENSEDISDMLEAWITFIERPTSEKIVKLEKSLDVLDDETISNKTGLSLKEIKELRNKK